MTGRLAVVAGVLLGVILPGMADEPGTMAKPNPQMQAVLDELAALGPKPIETLTPAEARKQPSAADAVKALLRKQGKSIAPVPVGAVKDTTVPGPVGPLPARVYTPTGTGTFPVLVYWHGGGWVLADLDTYDSSCRALCNAAGCVVVSCEYRHAPEAPFPAAAQDAYAAFTWVAANAAAVGGDPKRVAVGGESAGGNLAAGVALRAKQMKAPAPVHQLLVYPVTDQNYDTPSYRENAAAKPLNKPMMGWFWKQYLTGAPAATDYVAAPLQASNLSGLPPATVITAQIDPLRSEGRAYADKLKAAGVKVESVTFPGVTHEFFGMGAVLDDAKKAVSVAAAGLKTGFGK